MKKRTNENMSAKKTTFEIAISSFYDIVMKISKNPEAPSNNEMEKIFAVIVFINYIKNIWEEERNYIPDDIYNADSFVTGKYKDTLKMRAQMKRDGYIGPLYDMKLEDMLKLWCQNDPIIRDLHKNGE